MATTKITSDNITDGAVTSAKLDTNIAVGGTLGVTGATTMTGLTVTAATPSIQMTDSDNNADAYIQATDGNIRFYADDNNEAANSIVTFNIDGGEKVRIDSSGDVGIGTAVDLFKFTIGSSVATLPTYSNPSSGHDQAWMRSTNTGASTNYLQVLDIGVHGQTDATNGGSDIRFITQPKVSPFAPLERMRIDSNGNVGIGTGSPTEKLTVSGQITGGFGALTSGGTTDFNHVTNARSGMGHTLLNSHATNGIGVGSAYYHVVNYEYGSKDGSGNMTQIAIGYNDARQFMRYKFSGTWSSWHEM